ncbi:MAG: hypothetical protein RLZ35_1162 [Pseudomonadota bacterium]
MKALMVCVFLSGLFFFIHTVIWRYQKRFQSKKMLLIIMMVVFLFIGLFRLTYLQWFHSALAYFSVCFSYLIFYLWLENDSPTLRFIGLLSDQNGTPMSLATLNSQFIEKNPIVGRLDILVEEGFCVYEPPNYRLTKKGTVVARLCTQLSRLFNIALEG